jgi:hypothetical protein
MDYADRDIIPFIPDEAIIEYASGTPRWQPFCDLFYWLFGSRCSEMYTPDRPVYVCQPASRECALPFLVYFLTCALFPFQKQNDIMITNNSIIQYIRIKNEGVCGFFGPIANVEPFFWPCDGSSLICQTNSSFTVI